MKLDSGKIEKIKAIKSKSSQLKNAFNLDINNMDLSGTMDILPDSSFSNKLFLGRFSCENLISMMEQIGLIKHLKSSGFENLLVETDVDENRISYLKIYTDKKLPSSQLIDIRVSESTFIPEKHYSKKNVNSIGYDMIIIEWLSAKNPLVKFNSEKPQLPGQTHPGLGVLKYCFKMLSIMAKEVFKDGYLDIPDHMHGAIMYSKEFKFYDPAHEGVLKAMKRDLSGYSLYDITWGAITETVIDLTTNKPALYDPCEQIHPVSEKMKKYFKSNEYRKVLMKYYEKKKYFFDYEEMRRRRELILKTRKIEDL